MKKFGLILLLVFLVVLPLEVFGFSGLGAGTVGDPFQVTTCLQLNESRSNLSAYYKLMNDIDCSASRNWGKWCNANYLFPTYTQCPDSWGTGGWGFSPIGNPMNDLSAYYLDGNGKMISGLWMNATGVRARTYNGVSYANFDGAGTGFLEGYGSDYTRVRNFTLNNATIYSAYPLGAGIVLAGVYGGSVGYVNVYNSRFIGYRFNASSYSNRTGIFGYAGMGYNVNVQNVSVTSLADVGIGGGVINGVFTNVNITGNGSVGGVGGATNVSFSGVVVNSATGLYTGGFSPNGGALTNVKFVGIVTGFNYVGGLCGVNCVVDGGYSEGNITGKTVGGVTAYFTSGTLNNTYSRMRVNGTVVSAGLVGNMTGGNLYNSYFEGSVVGTNKSGLVGVKTGGNCYSSYYNLNVSGANTSACGLGKTIDELKVFSLYSGWDFTSKWFFTGSAPSLSFASPVVNVSSYTVGVNFTPSSFNESSSVVASCIGDNANVSVTGVNMSWVLYRNSYNYTNAWVSNSSLVTGMAYSLPDIVFNFSGNNKWTLIGGNGASGFGGQYWNGSTWVTNSSLVSGLPTNVNGGKGELFYNLTGDNKWALLYGNGMDGSIAGYVWSGSTWVSNSSVVSGLAGGGYATSIYAYYNFGGNNKQTFFISRMIGVQNYQQEGYQWSGSTWVSNSTLVSGLANGNNGLGGSILYNLTGDGRYYLFSVYSSPTDRTFVWNGSSWSVDGAIRNGVYWANRPVAVYGFSGVGSVDILSYFSGVSAYTWSGISNYVVSYSSGSSVNQSKNTSINLAGLNSLVAGDNWTFSCKVDNNVWMNASGVVDNDYRVNWVVGSEARNSVVGRNYLNASFVATAKSGVSLANVSLELKNSSGSVINSSIDYGSLTGASISYSFTGLSDGWYSLNANVCKASGCSYSRDASRSVYVDTVYPSISFLNGSTSNGSSISDNVVYNVSVYDVNLKNVSVFLYNSTSGLVRNSSRDTYTYCYQESANASSNGCGTALGSYGHNQSVNLTLNIAKGYVYINYSKPNLFYNGTMFQLKAGRNASVIPVINASIPDDCLNQEFLQIRLTSYSFWYNDPYDIGFDADCWNGNNYTSLISRHYSFGSGLFQATLMNDSYVHRVYDGDANTGILFGCHYNSHFTEENISWCYDYYLGNAISDYGILWEEGIWWNTTLQSLNYSGNFNGLSSGVYVLNASACDGAGYCNKTESRTFTIDSLYPTISFTSPTETNLDVLYRRNVLMNATGVDLNSANVTLRVYNSSGSVVNSSTSSSRSYCYQETANVSTSCGGLATGSYNALKNQGDGYGNNVAYIYINYTKPANALSSSLWSMKIGTKNITNVSLPTSCWNADANKLIFRMFMFDSGVATRGECYTGSSWVGLLSDSVGSYGHYTDYTYVNENRTDFFWDGNWTTYLSYCGYDCPNVWGVGRFGEPYAWSSFLYGSRFYEEAMWWAYGDIVNYQNFSGLGDGIYRLNATACDLVGNCNSTETRNVTVNSTLTFTGLAINPATVVANSDLNCSFSFTNVPVEDFVWGNVTWLKNNVSVQSNIFNGTSNVSVAGFGFSKNDNLTCRVQAFNLYKSSTSYDYETVANSPHVISNVTTTPVPLRIFNSFRFRVNVSDADNDVSSVNLSVAFPNGTVSHLTTTQSGGWWQSGLFTASNGSYLVNVTADDVVQNNAQINVTDVVVVSPASFTSTQEAGLNYTFNVSVVSDSDEVLDYNLSFWFSNASLFTGVVEFNPLSVTWNGTTRVDIEIDGLAPDDTYNGTLNVTRLVDGRVWSIPLTLGVSSNFGQPFVVNKQDWSTAIRSDQSDMRTFVINNTGTYNLTNCVPSVDGTFTGWGFVQYSNSSFDVPVGGTKSLNVTFYHPSVGTYDGDLNVVCVATLGGQLNGLQVSNQPVLHLVSSAPPIIPPAGGGGGGQTVIEVKGGENQTLFTVSTDSGSLMADLYMYPSQVREQTFVVTSKVANDQQLSLTCVGNFCPYVTFSKSSFKLVGNSQEVVVATLSVPDAVAYGTVFTYDFEITDGIGHTGVVRTQVEISKFSRWYSKYSPVVREGDSGYWFSLGGFAVPKLLLYLLLVLGSEILCYFLLPKGDKYKDISTIVYVGVGVFVFVLGSVIY